jgi:hypothetical protein
MIAKITGKLRMMKKYILQWLILPILLTSCGTFSPPRDRRIFAHSSDQLPEGDQFGT